MTNPVIDLLKSHRSIRKFTDQPMDDALLKDLVATGQCAATSSYLQAASVIRVRNPQVRKQLEELSGNQAYVSGAAEFLVFCADLHRNAWCCEQDGKTMADGMTEHFILATVDAALFAQNVVVAAESEGLGICYIGALRNDPAKVSELLNLPEHVYPVFGLCLGYPAQDPEVKPRLPLDMILMDEQYQSVNEDKMNDYDQQTADYYLKRTGSKPDKSWSKDMADKLSKESRPHMKAFLASKGFKLR